MAKLIESKERKCIKDAIAVFGCVREETLEKYVELINNTKFYSKSLINDVVLSTLACKYNVARSKYVKSSPAAETDITAANAFEAYVALLTEYPDVCNKESEVRVSLGRYPYNYVATFNNKTYAFIVYDYTGDRRLAHHNKSIQSDNDDINEQVVLVIPPGYDLEALDGIILKGIYRIAIIRNNDPQNLTCLLSETYKGD